MKLNLVILLYFLTQQLFAQDNYGQFGSVSYHDVQLNTYERDPEAGAVVLFDLGESVFVEAQEREDVGPAVLTRIYETGSGYFGGYNIEYSRTRRIKILDKTGLKYAHVSIPLYTDGQGKSEKIKSLQAFTYNIKNGNLEKIQLDKSTIVTEVLDSRHINENFIFPDVQKGSVIEYQYVVESPFHFNLPDWTFQDKIPTVFSQYVVRMIPFYEYVFALQGIKGFSHHSRKVDPRKREWGAVTEVYSKNVGNGVEFQDVIHTFALENVPAFKDESYISSINDYIIKIDFQLAKFHSPNGISRDIISTWPDLNKSLLRHADFGKYIKSCSRYAKIINNKYLELDNKSTLEKAQEIIEFAKDKYKWNGISSRLASKSSKQFFEQKYGNSADINLFLIALLKSAGLNARPVILSTRSNGKFSTKHPFLHFFNHVVVLVNGERQFIADASDSYLPYDKIPPRSIGGKGLIVEDELENWISLTNQISSKEEKKIGIKPDPERSIFNVWVSIQATEYKSYNYKVKLNNDISVIKDFFSHNFDKVGRVETFNFDQPLKPYIINFEAETNIKKTGEGFSLAPFFSLAIADSILSQRKRPYPVDFVFSNEEYFDITIDIPEGFEVSDLPESYNITIDLVDIELSYVQKSTVITINGMYALKKAVYSPNEYSSIKYYLDKIATIFNDRIFFKKIQ